MTVLNVPTTNKGAAEITPGNDYLKAALGSYGYQKYCIGKALERLVNHGCLSDIKIAKKWLEQVIEYEESLDLPMLDDIADPFTDYGELYKNVTGG